MRRAFHAMDEINIRRPGIADDFHFEQELALIVQFRLERDDVGVRRHDTLQIFEHVRPGKRFALNERIQELRLVASAAVRRQIQIGLCRCPLVVTLGDLRLKMLDGVAIASGIDPAAQGKTEQHERYESKRANTNAPTRPEFTRVFVGPSREIDIETHSYAISAPTTPAIRQRGTDPLVEPIWDAATN